MSKILSAKAKVWKESRSCFLSGAPIAKTTETVTDIDGVPISTFKENSLGLPSHLSSDLRSKLPSVLIECEISLRRAEVEESILSLRRVIRILEAAEHEKAVNARGQTQNTRANVHLEDLRKRRGYFIDTYNHSRECLISLGCIVSDTEKVFYPALKLDDTYRRNPSSRRVVNASNLFDGSLWSPIPHVDEDLEDGWIWRVRRRCDPGVDTEIEDWELETDRVQWFRTEAEFFRWLEQ